MGSKSRGMFTSAGCHSSLLWCNKLPQIQQFKIIPINCSTVFSEPVQIGSTGSLSLISQGGGRSEDQLGRLLAGRVLRKNLLTGRFFAL